MNTPTPLNGKAHGKLKKYAAVLLADESWPFDDPTMHDMLVRKACRRAKELGLSDDDAASALGINSSPQLNIDDASLFSLSQGLSPTSGDVLVWQADSPAKPEPPLSPAPTAKSKARPANATELQQRKSNNQQPFLLAWRRAVCSASGPTSATTRLVLLCISLYSNMAGLGAYPGQARLAADTALSLSTVKRCIAHAVADGWLQRKRKPQLHGGAGGYEYSLRLPTEGGHREPGSP